MSHRQSPPRRKTRHKATRIHVLHFHCCCGVLFLSSFPIKRRPGKSRGRSYKMCWSTGRFSCMLVENLAIYQQILILRESACLPAHFIGTASGEHHHGIIIASSPPPSFLPVPPQPSSSFLLFVLLCSVQFAVVFARLASDTKEQRKKARRRTSFSSR